MRKTHKINTTDIEKKVMEKVTTNQITMKPRWYFVLGSTLMIAGLASFAVLATFLTNLTIFLLKKHGPNGQWRLQQIIESFPMWVPILAIVGIVIGIWMLKKYDFSYKKNFWLIVLAFITSILLTAFFLDYTGLDNIWMKQGPMKHMYQFNDEEVYRRGSGRGYGRMMMQNR